ncbi:MbtH family protein [Paenarthrobacter sp. YAF11_1]|uniref:MbtH family protein n=1 Tax=Micrococcaceae TaxID=1268 RepID=UPI0028831D72|nr:MULTISPECIES: MbtH family protein [unclassified Arthrobacter]
MTYNAPEPGALLTPEQPERSILVTNPFDDTSATFSVLVNEYQQHSLWPSFAATPKGWVAMFGPDNREACLEYVSQTWLDMAPRKVAELAASQ